MTEERCPFCETALINLQRIAVPDTKSLYCEKCELELVQYPSTNKKGVQCTGLHALIPLAKFSRGEWTDFLFGERNVYGEPMPDRMPSFSSTKEKRLEQKLREQSIQKRREWRQRVS